ncbi:MAG: hypothetical protein V4712_00740 [Pseudomonadota bacterium]
MSNHEIEDVLSSIRRLVSEDLRPAVPRPAAAVVDSKLILTPALRVVAAEPVPDLPLAPLTRDGFEILSGPRLAVVDPAPPEPAPLDAAPDAGPDLALTGFGQWQGTEEEAEAAPDAVDWEGDIWGAGPDMTPALSDDLTEAAQGLALPADGASPLADEAPMWSDASDQTPVWDEAPPDAWVAEEPIPFVAHPRKPAPAPANPLAQAWADRAEAAVRAELQEATEAKLAEAKAPDMAEGLFAADPAGLDALPFDEETLREIVRDIIREELAGTLGERITRNVRKLVRVEINRALATRSVE